MKKIPYILALAFLVCQVWAQSSEPKSFPSLEQVYANTLYYGNGKIYMNVRKLRYSNGAGSLFVDLTYVPKDPEHLRRLKWFYNTYRQLIKKYDPYILFPLSHSSLTMYGEVAGVQVRVNEQFRSVFVDKVRLRNGKVVDILNAKRGDTLPEGDPVSVTLSESISWNHEVEEPHWFHHKMLVLDLFTGEPLVDADELKPSPSYTYSERGVVVYVSLQGRQLVVHVFPRNLHGLSTLESLRKSTGIFIDFNDQDSYSMGTYRIRPHDWTILYHKREDQTIGLKHSGTVYLSKDPQEVSIGWTTYK